MSSEFSILWRCLGLSHGIYYMPSFELNKNSHQLQAMQRGQKRNVPGRSDLHLVCKEGSIIGIARYELYKSRVGSRGTALCRTATASAYMKSQAKCKGVKPESRKTLQLQTTELDGLTEHDRTPACLPFKRRFLGWSPRNPKQSD